MTVSVAGKVEAVAGVGDEDGEVVLVAGLAGVLEAAAVEETDAEGEPENEAEAELVAVRVEPEIEEADIGQSAYAVVNEAELDGATVGPEVQHMAEAGSGDAAEDGGGHGVVDTPAIAFE